MNELALSESAIAAGGAIIAALFAAAATGYAAVQSRRASSATVDVRILSNLQEEVVRLQSRLESVRTSLFIAQDETDKERAIRRQLQVELARLQDLAARLASALETAGIPMPEATMRTALNLHPIDTEETP